MSAEFSGDKNIVATPRNGLTEAERRTHDSAVAKVLGGTRASEKKIGVGRGVIWFSVIALVLAAWPVSQGWVIKPSTGLGYYFGLVGGVMMLLMLLYPLRKHVSWTRNWGPLRYWFMVHMVFGIGGPTLVLFHTTFHVKSLNAGVALYSMLLVASSGIVGRFIYTRIHHGLYGRKSNLQELQQAVGTNQEKVHTVLFEAPGIGDKLNSFKEMAMSHEGALPVRVWKFMALGWRSNRLAKKCHKDLRQAVAYLAKSQGWNPSQQQLHLHEAALHVNDYLLAVQQAAQFSSYERLFRLWHVLHSPFVWLLGISGIVHVIATKFMY